MLKQPNIQPCGDRAAYAKEMLSNPIIRSVKTRAKPKHPEGDLQIACLKWYRYAHPRYKKHLFAIPNQLVRKGRNAQFLALQGVIAGIPDLMLAVPKLHYHGLFVEMKAKDGKLSPNQKEAIERLTNAGYKCEVCNSVDQFMEIVNEYLG